MVEAKAADWGFPSILGALRDSIPTLAEQDAMTDGKASPKTKEKRAARSSPPARSEVAG